MNQALIDSIQADLDKAYADDLVKPVCVPFNTLGKEMIDRLPKVDCKILVVSDLGLLVALLKRLHAEGRGFEEVTFVAHTQDQQFLSQNLGVKTLQVGYNDPIKVMEKQLMGLKFDVVVGNPPYQGLKEGSNSIWKKFIDIAFKHARDGGVVSLVTPKGWLNDTKAMKILRSNDLVYADLDCGIYFKGVGSTFSWWLAFKRPNTGSTVLLDRGLQVHIDLQELETFPARNMSQLSIEIHRKFVATPSLVVNWCGNFRDVSKIKTEQYKFPAYNTKAQPLVWLRKDHFISTKKVILQSVSSFAPFYDDGTIGVARQSGFIEVENSQQGANLVAFLNSKLFMFILKTTKTDGWNPIRHVPALDWDRPWTDSELYTHFGLSEAEIELIEQTVK